MATQEQTETGGDKPKSPETTESPSPEFSFTPPIPDKNIAHPTPSAASPLDLSPPPAGDVIFRGHLLPLNLISFLQVSPRASPPNSTDSFAFALPKHTLEVQNGGARNYRAREAPKEKKKSKSISWALGLGKWRRRSDRKIAESKEKEKQKRYSRILEPLLRWWRRRSKGDSEEVMRRGYSVSAPPASWSLSPANSTLSATAVMSPSPAIAEELQGAIESAIAHCKNSIAVGEQHKG